MIIHGVCTLESVAYAWSAGTNAARDEHSSTIMRQISDLSNKFCNMLLMTLQHDRLAYLIRHRVNWFLGSKKVELNFLAPFYLNLVPV
jgi:hypothetical protein